MKKAILLLGLAFLIILFSGCINPPICGNGICEQGETPENCSINTGGDCPSIDLCGNGVCDTSLGETAENCPQDCGTQEANVELIDLSPTFFKANKDLRFEATVYFSKGTDNSKFSSEAKFVLVDSLGNKMEIPAEFTWNADGTGKLAGGTSKIDLAFGNTNLTAVLAFNGKNFIHQRILSDCLMLPLSNAFLRKRIFLQAIK